ncbi:MAG: P-type conjugative transfer protein TrbJ [Proteobacteria bacterium]|nr:P-type conjugative transfer protein TrbJ [Pseudomonadota bacterium]MBU1586281.1 P-type conjugative transfer protein TrbJ [Pseudomonadota bacterium]MBU2453177.1 P-type conjugative transfer protein TrbJ [Pseudomonadota bacterium]MBU2630792.1 P-type conjugative transfer protein TrbJ [Pseudomonadota bacterium]
MAKILKQLLPFYIVFIVACNSHAGSVAGFGGSTEITQILNNIQLMASYVEQATAVQNQITQITNQLSMYQNMITNTQNMISNPFQNAMATIMQLKTVIDNATQLSYTIGSVDTYFQQLHPNYATLFQGNNYANQQQFWRDSVYDQCEASLKASNFSVSNIQSEAQILQTLNQASQSAAGQKAAIQVGNEIALAMAAKMDQLKLLTASQAQTQSVYLSQQKAEDEATDMYRQDLYQRNPNDVNHNDNTIITP